MAIKVGINGFGRIGRNVFRSAVQSFPDMLFAKPMGFTEEEYYKDEDPAIQSAPKIDFQQA